jgi:hypothetical protein
MTYAALTNADLSACYGFIAVSDDPPPRFVLVLIDGRLTVCIRATRETAPFRMPDRTVVGLFYQPADVFAGMVQIAPEDVVAAGPEPFNVVAAATRE